MWISLNLSTGAEVCPIPHVDAAVSVFRILVLLTVFSLLSWFTYQIFMKHHIVHILYLYYL